MKPLPHHTIATWFLEAWEEISPETIKKFFKSCALNLAIDGSEDNLIHCFKEGEPCKSGKEILQSQLSTLTKKNVNPFEIDKNDAAVATPEFPIVDSDHDEDEDIDSDICN